MTVKELIEYASTFDPKADVIVSVFRPDSSAEVFESQQIDMCDNNQCLCLNVYESLLIYQE